MDWFTVDKNGLAKLLRQRGPGFLVYELYQNAVDEKTTKIKIELSKKPSSPYAQLRVEDDSPDGFRNLSEAWTLFAESQKKGDPKKRGWMNLGEKLVIACCREARIVSTTGTVIFDAGGRRTISSGRKAGTVFEGEVRLTHDEVREALRAAGQILVPEGVTVTVNGEPISARKVAGVESGRLETRVANDEGEMIRTKRESRIEIFHPLPGEPARLYEMGIPVVETGDKYDVNVLQKVPLNTDRDNVPPSYLRQIRTMVLNTMASELSAEEASEKWVREATSSPDVNEHAFRKTMELRFGDKRVGVDPSDREAENIAKAQGYTIVSGGSMTAGEWENARRTSALLPAGRVTPSPKPFSPDGELLKFVLPSTADEERFVALAERVGEFLLGGIKPIVSLTNTPSWGFNAAWGRTTGQLIVNIGRLGRAWFARSDGGGPSEGMLDLLIHEFAHDAGNHLESSYHDACTKFGAKLVLKALVDPAGEDTMTICNMCETGMHQSKPCRLHDPSLCEICHDAKAVDVYVNDARTCKPCFVKQAKRDGGWEFEG